MNIQVACVQFCASNNAEDNRATVTALIHEAAQKKAQLVCTPEMTNLIERDNRKLLDKTVAEKKDPTLSHYRTLARELNIHLLIGSLAIRLNDRSCANRSYLISDNGDLIARYDKIHLFDVDLVGGTNYRESASYSAGTRAVLANAMGATFGFSICYDLRFPNLYRALAKAGAGILFVPAAFTQQTGQAHWHSLIRARAIETGCFVVAPAQCGQHHDGSKSFGHSLVVDPWGKVITQASENQSEIIMATLDLKQIDEVRKRIPSLAAAQEFTMPER